GAAVAPPPAQVYRLRAAADLLPDRLLRVEAGPALVHVAQFHRLPEAHRAAIRLFLPGDQAQQRRLARAVGPDHADDRAGGNGQAQVVDEQPVVVALAHAVQLDHQVAEARAGRDIDLQLFAPLLRLLAEQLFVVVHARLTFGLPGARRHVDPFQ